MYRVLLVEDEPPAIRQMRILVERYCKKFEVVGEAENGLEGIEKIRELKPDVVITDVQMPLMDGIEFVAKVKSEMPDLVFLIVSGFNEFEYARAAITYGVNDYLLKPVTPMELSASMGKIEKILEKTFYEKRNHLLKRMAGENTISAEEMKKYFPYEKYYMSVIRVKGIPGRFMMEGKLEIYSEIDETIAVYGRDYHEGLYLIPYEVIENSDVKMFHRKIIKQYQGIESYYTFVYFPEPVKVAEMPENMKALYQILDKRIVIGCSQMINGMENQEIDSKLDLKDVNEILNRTDYLCRRNEYGKLKKEISLLFGRWKQEARTQAYVEYMMKQILYKIAQNYRKGTDRHLLESEDILEEILAAADCMEDVRDGFLDMLFQNFQMPVVEKVDTPEFSDLLKEYVRKHIAEEISLTGVCRTFGVSQPYFSKIFRKYTNKSFNQYITEQRMERAKEIMRQNQDMLVKDVALQVGYSNQFYFSRIFHAYTQMSPTEYFDLEHHTKNIE